MTGETPRLAPLVIQRSRLLGWLERNARAPLRLLTAPPGSGKTTIAVTYVQQAPEHRAYYSFPERSSPAACQTILEGIRELVTAHAPLEIIVDDVDRADPASLAELRRLAVTGTSDAEFVYVTRSSQQLDLHREIAQGIVAVCDEQLLAFDASGIRRLADAHGVSYTHHDVARLLENTEGWAIVVAGAIRRAAVDGATLEGAFERWRQRDGTYFQAFIDKELERHSESDRRAFERLLHGARGEQTEVAQRLNALGLFVRSDGEGTRPYRSLSLLQTVAVAQGRQTSAALPFTTHLFGRFHATIGDRVVPWIRRREQHIVTFLLLKPSLSATRDEVIETFWPATDNHLASQSLRTACSNIRKALASIVGYDAVDRYFHANAHTISLDAAAVVSDVRTFKAHIQDADGSFQRGDYEAALRNYTAARSLYADALLAAEGDAGWALPSRTLYEEMYVMALERVAEIYTELGKHEQSRAYVEEVLRLQPLSARARALLARSFQKHGSFLNEQRRLLLV